MQAAGVAVHELVGPEPTTHRDLITATARLMGHNVSIGAIPIWTAKLGATMAGWVATGRDDADGDRRHHRRGNRADERGQLTSA